MLSQNASEKPDSNEKMQYLHKLLSPTAKMSTGNSVTGGVMSNAYEFINSSHEDAFGEGKDSLYPMLSAVGNPNSSQSRRGSAYPNSNNIALIDASQT